MMGGDAEVLLLTAALLLATWGFCLLLVACAGRTLIWRLTAAVWAIPMASMWWGLALATFIALLLNLVLPLQDPAALMIVVALVLTGAAGVLYRARLGRKVRGVRWSLDWIAWAWVLPTAGSCLAIAILAAGMPTNYDTGLYHLNAIDYASYFGTVPGLANLHDRLGFNASIYPLAAALGSGFWSEQGFRVVTGLFLVAMVADAVLRVMRGTSRRKPGTAVMVVGTVLIVGYAVQEPGRLIASPVADVMAAALTVVATAYLLDAVTSRRNLLAAATSTVVACLAATARPLGWIFAALVIGVLLIRFRRGLLSGITWSAALLGGALLAVMLARDVLLSGWLLYPLGLFPLPVEWRFPDPSLTREAITAWGRAPHMPIETAQSLSAWLPGWFANLPRDWAVMSLVLLIVGACALALALFTRHRRWPQPTQHWWLALIPAAVTCVLWFITAPDPRFAWGLLVCLGLVPFAAFVSTSPRAVKALPIAGGFVLCCALALSWFRGGFIPVLKDATATSTALGPWSITLELAPVKQVEARSIRLAEGSTVIEPAEGLQCWALFPLCRVPGADPNIALRGATVAEGFRAITIP